MEILIYWIVSIPLKQKTNLLLFVIDADLECKIEKADGCKNDPAKSSTTKVSKHIPSGF